MRDACWNAIGVHGDATCPELPRHVHCRNCGVYSSAAVALFDRESSADDVATWTKHFARPKAIQHPDTQSFVIFRLGQEWLALPAGTVDEVLDERPVHGLPHRRGGALLGLVNVRGELVVCVSLNQLLNSGPSLASRSPRSQSSNAAWQRLLVIRRGQVRAVFAADEVHGMHRCDRRDLSDLPATIAKCGTTHAAALLTWGERSVGVIDLDRLFSALERSLHE
jgi:chemotaxis-related protein WspD